MKIQKITVVATMCACVLFSISGELAQAEAEQLKTSTNEGTPAADVEQTVSLDRIKAGGWLGERVDRSHRAVQNLRSSIWWDQGDMWAWEHPARWVRNMSFFCLYTGIREPALGEDADRFLKMYDEGKLHLDYKKLSIGPSEDGETLKGLLAYYELSGDPRILEAAKGIGRNIASQVDLTQQYYKPLAVGPLMKLFAITGDSSFKTLAIKIAEEKQLEFTTMKAHGAIPGMALCGYLDLYKSTGDRRYLDWAIKGWKATRDRAFVTGGLGEVLDFTAPPSESDLMCETCQTSWWLMLNLHLWKATGNTDYLDMAERIFYNHFAFSQAHRGEGGGFLAGGDIDQGVRGVHNYYCCDNEGTLGLLELLQYIFTQDRERRLVGLNLFFDSEARLNIGGQEIKIRQTTDYPERGVLKVAIDTKSPVQFTLRFRIPKWTSVSSATVNGQRADCTIKDSYLLINRTWSGGDDVNVVFPLSMHAEADMTGRGIRSGAVTVNGEKKQAKRLAVFYGPLVVAMFRTGHGNDLNWIWTGDYTDVLDSGGDAKCGYPASESDIFELDGKSFNSGGVPAMTTADAGKSVPKVSWNFKLDDNVQVNYEVKVLPGLPVTLDYHERISGWNGKGRLLCSGVRFSRIKDVKNSAYDPFSLPYPMPCVTTKPDLENHVVYAGIYGMYEQLTNNATLPTTGTYFLNNGYFGAICLYDTQSTRGLICQSTDKYAGLYLEPKAASDVTISRRMVFPLSEQPQNQTTAKQRMEKAAKVTAKFDKDSNTLVLAGPVLQGAPVTISKSIGIEAGCSIWNEKVAADVLDYDKDTVVVYLDVPGTYHVKTPHD